MPYCEACARHWTPTSMRPDGSCPTCGQVLELRRPLPPPAAAGGTRRPGADHEDGDDEEARPSAPWHFKVMLVALVVYLAWRGVQGIDWIAQRL